MDAGRMRVAVMRCMRGVVTAAPVEDVGRYMAGNVRRKMRMPATNMRSAKMHCAAAATPVAPSSAEVGAPSSAEVDAPTTATAPAAAPDAAARQRHIGGAHRNCERTHTCKKCQDYEPGDQLFVDRAEAQGPGQDTHGDHGVFLPQKSVAPKRLCLWRIANA